jgi:pimeloyl-ACP methyl ester carboxylesterase
MSPRIRPRAALLALCLAFARPAPGADLAGADAPNRFAATLAASERFEVGGVLVERHGAASGRPLILVPGLASGSWAWQETIRAFAGSHPVYVLTLPGFDGRPPAGGAPFAAARTAILELIASRRLDHPVIVGHSLGAMLGMAVAEDQPELLGGLVSIDGLPVMPGTEDMSPSQRAGLAETMRERIAPQLPERFAAQQRAYLRTIGVVDMGKADDLARLTARSDPASVARYAADVLALDLRPGLKRIAAPVLLIMPFFDVDAEPAAQTESGKADYYRALMAGTPNLQLATVAPARHFAMIDQPQMVDDALGAYLARLR